MSLDFFHDIASGFTLNLFIINFVLFQNKK